jgi:hypothetical protein
LVAVNQTTGTGPKLPESLAQSFIVGYTHSMIIAADARRRVTLPKPAHPGDAFDLEKTGPGQFLLTRLEKPARKVTLRRENGFLVATSAKRITLDHHVNGLA